MIGYIEGRSRWEERVARSSQNLVARPGILSKIPPANQMKFPRTLHLRLFQLNSAGETQTLHKEEISCASAF
jgi:hypothetical protein